MLVFRGHATHSSAIIAVTVPPHVSQTSGKRKWPLPVETPVQQ